VPSEIALLRALGSGRSELEQVLALHRATGEPEPERLTLGTGDRRLLALYRGAVGGELELTLACPACGCVNAVELAPEAVASARPRVAVAGAGGGLREPTYGDLLELPADAAAAERELVARCTVGTPARAPVPDDLALVDDSLAGPLLAACADCGASVEAPLDVQRAALEGIERRVGAVELEVHLLARAYGWSLEAIESLPDARRRRLAELVEEGR
jgi:hypothetical protein